MQNFLSFKHALHRRDKFNAECGGSEKSFEAILQYHKFILYSCLMLA